MLNYLMSAIVMAALGTFLLGFGWRAIRLLRILREHRPAVASRSPTPYPTPRRSWAKSVWLAHGAPWAFWWKTNPWRFAAHAAYHLGLYAAVATYLVGFVLLIPQLSGKTPWEALLAACGWAVESKQATPICTVFKVATVMAVAGLTAPFILRHCKAGRFRAPDEVVKSLGLVPKRRPRKGRTAIERKAIGYVVLAFDLALAASFVMPWPLASTIRMAHAVFVVGLMALLPYTFLFHEIWVVVQGAMAVWRYRDGRIG